MSKYTALLQIQMPEYFTSLAAGIAGGPFDRRDSGLDVPVGGVQTIRLDTVMKEHVAPDSRVMDCFGQ